MDLSHESYRHQLIHTPIRQWNEDPHDCFVYQSTPATPRFSIVMPIFNQETIIRENLSRIVEMTGGTYELILILDGCTDRTREIVLEWCSTQKWPPSLYLLRVIESNVELFETSCDNLGFVLARGTYIIEVQCDMRLELQNYNVFLVTPMEIYPDLIAVSGRCCHGVNRSSMGLSLGKWGEVQQHPVPLTTKVYLSHTVNRGPLAFRRTMLKSLGYLDEQNYVLGDDEHDLFARAWVYNKWRTAYVPIAYESKLEWGATRKPKPDATVQAIQQRTTNNGFYSTNVGTIQYPPSEIRHMNPFLVSMTHAKLSA